MADRGSSGGSGCNDRCGCPSPCPGGQGCRCTSSGGGESGMQHTYCTCGSHCGCNPCTCDKSQDRARAGKTHCKCGEGCTCATCAS